MPPYSRYEDALIAQQRLYEWTISEPGLRFMLGFFTSQNEIHTPEAQRDPVALARIQVAMLREAEPVYVSPDACDLVDHARETWKPEPVLGSDAFTPYGFVLFPRPIMLDDMPVTEENPMRAPAPPGSLNGYIPVRAMAWLSIISEDAQIGTFWVSFYTAVEDEFRLADELGVPDRWTNPPPGHPAYTRDHVRRNFPMSMVHMWQWSWGNDGNHEYGDWDDPDRYDVMPQDSFEQMRERARQQCGLIQTFWRIASQFVPARHRLPRQLRRDAARHGIAAKEVTVITLRRERERPDYDPEPTGREYHVSFLVRGYWATRHTRNGPRQVWVRPHLKGQGPFQETARGWEFTR